MIKDTKRIMTMKFKLTISNCNFDAKPSSIDYSRMRFNQTEINVEQLQFYVRNGYSFTNLFNKESISIKEKTINNYIGTQCVFIDIDNSSLYMEDAYAKISLKPTLSYTTFSNTQDKPKYRFVYVLSKVIGLNEHRSFVTYISSLLKNELNITIDNASLNVNQLFNGSNEECIIIANANSIIDVDANESYFNLITEDKTVRTNSKDNEIKIDIEEIELDKDREFFEFYNEKSYTEIVKEYEEKYPIIEETPYTLDAENAITMLPEDYYCIIRLRKNGKPVRIEDGHNRRKKLFLNGLIRRKINPSISLAQLLVNLSYEMVYFIDNTGDDKIKKDELYRMAKGILTLDMDEYNEALEEYKKNNKILSRKFVINKAYCKANHININAIKTIAAKDSRYDEYMSFYKDGMKLNDHLRKLQDNGIKCSRATLYRCYAAFGLIQGKSNVIENEEYNDSFDITKLKYFNEDTFNEMFENNNNGKIPVSCKPSSHEKVEMKIKREIRLYKEELKNAEIEANNDDSNANTIDLSNDNEVIDTNITMEETTPIKTLKQEIEEYSKTNTLYSTFTYYYGNLTTDEELIQLKEWVNESDSNCKTLWLIMLESRIGSESTSLAYAS